MGNVDCSSDTLVWVRETLGIVPLIYARTHSENTTPVYYIKNEYVTVSFEFLTEN